MTKLRDIVERAVKKNKLDIIIPQNITKAFLRKLIQKEVIDYDLDETNEEIIEKLDNLGDKVFVFSKRHRIPSGDVNVLRKDIDVGAYKKLDSTESINILIDKFNTTHNYRIPKFTGWKISDDIARTLELTPQKLAMLAQFDIENPSIGMYWVGKDGHFRVKDWMSALKGSRIFFFGNVEETQKRHYGKSIKYLVNSPEDEYKVTLSSMPITKLKDDKQYSLWMNAKGKCECNHASFMSEQHEKQANPLDAYCKHIEAASLQDVLIVNYRDIAKQRAELKAKGMKGHRNVIYNEEVYRIFLPLLAKRYGMSKVNKLKNQTLVVREKGTPQPLNDTELNTFIGAYIGEKNGFNKFFFRMDNPIDFSDYKYFLRK